MGTDIHAVIEYRPDAECLTDKPWQAFKVSNKYFNNDTDKRLTKCHLDLNRNYDLFAILANVRNGRGFAGVRMAEPFNFISNNRGVPKDVALATIEALSGEYSPTYVTLKEILAFDWLQSSIHYGVVSAAEFWKWRRTREWKAAPDSYCGAVHGPGIEHVDEATMLERIETTLFANACSTYAEEVKYVKDALPNFYTRISWIQSYTESTPEMWTQILPRMLMLGNMYGYENVRLVMDFDS